MVNFSTPAAGCSWEVGDVLVRELRHRAVLDLDAVEVTGGGGRGSQGNSPATGGVDGDVGHLHPAAGDATQLARALLHLAEVGLTLSVADEDDAAVGGPSKVRRRGDGRHASQRSDGVPA